MERVRGYKPTKILSASRSLINSLYHLKHTTSLPIRADQIQLLTRFEQNNDELIYARNSFYEVYLAWQEKSTQQHHNYVHDVIAPAACTASGISGLILLDGSLEIGLAAGFIAFPLFCFLDKLHSAFKNFKEYHYPYALFKKKYQKLIAEHIDLAKKLNKTAKYSLDDIDVRKYQLQKKIEYKRYCLHCTTIEDLCTCTNNSKKLIERQYASYLLIKKEQYLK